MEKKRRIVSKLIFALVIAAVLSLCFVGTTLARYASGASGSGTVQVAKWNVSFDDTASTTVSFGMISPSEAVYTDGGEARSNVSDKMLVATITNKSDVEADVTVTINYSELTFKDGTTPTPNDVTFGTGSDWSSGTNTDPGSDGYTAPTRKNVESLFSFNFYTSTTSSTATDSSVTAVDESSVTDSDTGISFKHPLSAGSTTPQTLYVFVEVVWTSADDTLEDNADALDTWVGQNVATLGVTLHFSAVQGSELPTT